ncbi:MAG: Flp family type IVb pilin [Anaerolineales bacterium]|nr:Flp family type IVb pilin [Anaerolineales bacterium]
MKSSNKKHEKGQGLVEYALILVLVAIVVIGTLTILGPSIGNVFSSINNSITTAGSGGGGGGTLIDCGFYGSATLSCGEWHAACSPGPACVP